MSPRETPEKWVPRDLDGRPVRPLQTSSLVFTFGSNGKLLDHYVNGDLPFLAFIQEPAARAAAEIRAALRERKGRAA